MNRFFNSRFYRTFAYGMTAAMVNALVPTGLGLILGGKGGPMMPAHKKETMPASRPLALKEMKKITGKDTLSPYLSGSSKWDLNYKGVDLCTGNYTQSVTDLDFQGGYGIPVSIQRTYSANDLDDGPFGPGWSLSADVRTSAGGLLKKSKSQVFSVPKDFKELAPGLSNPRNSAATTGTVATDSSAMPEVVQKDCDGILTTPAYDNNISNPTYAMVLFNGAYYQVQTSNQTTTADGTVYNYGTYGSYTGTTGMKEPGSSTSVPSNVLKVSSVVDRQGNTTTYNYSSGYFTFYKTDGTTSEKELTSVSMPNGHVLTISWTTVGSFNRIGSISDTGGRTVTYGYNSNGMLTSVTTPGGKVTQYGYGTATLGVTVPGEITFSANDNPLLTSITDPRGLVTSIGYDQDSIDLGPYMNEYVGADQWDDNGYEEPYLEGYLCASITAPNGDNTQFVYPGATLAFGGNQSNLYGAAFMPAVYEFNAQSEPYPYQMFAYGWQTVVNGTTVTYQLAETMPPPLNPGQGEPELTADGYYGGGGQLGTWYTVQKTYDPNSQQCLQTETSYSRQNQGAWHYDTLTTWTQPATDVSWSITNDVYNFQSNPLWETTQNYMTWGGQTDTNYPDTTVAKFYAYWGQNKYFQQKAVIDRLSVSAMPGGASGQPCDAPGSGYDTANGRVSFTDYYTNTAAAGSRGQTYQTYSSAFSTSSPPFLDLPGQVVLPATNNDWQDNIAPESGTPYVSQATYDSVGRCTSVQKLQTMTGGAHYVTTNTVYTDGTGWWGEPYSVTEDAGGINRTTYTLAYDDTGHATSTEDAKGHTFQTNYVYTGGNPLNTDYQVQNIQETDNGQTLVTYTYGTGADNGQVLTVTDGLSNITDTFTYDDTPASGDGGIGQPATVTETWPSTIPGGGYNVAYSYNINGDRQNVTYTTANGVNTWQYADYTAVGGATNASHVPQTLRQLDSNGNPTPEEFHYLYDSAGHLTSAGFAMQPQSGYTPPTGQPYYSNVETPLWRAHVTNDIDAAGHLLNMDYYWENEQSNGTYAQQYITGFQYAYDPVTMLKTTGTFLDPNSGGTSWVTDHVEDYTYDGIRDYLTQAQYNDSYSNPSDSWGYDAAGNRTSDANTGYSTYDNLNRQLTSPAGSYGSDILGNRLSDPSGNVYVWDQLNRLTSFTPGTNPTWSYAYRTDGLRVFKSNPNASTSYAYDGQVGFEDVDAGSSPAVTDYALGGRSIERIAKNVGGTANVAYPIYDGHGNMVSTLSYSGNGFALSNRRPYDAWGNIRNSDSSGDPKGRYCASLGHKQDDESGLNYMRARFYDPACGSFISQDSGMNGRNWFAYADNDPINRVDPSGDSGEWAYFALMVFLCYLAIQMQVKSPAAAWSLMLAACKMAQIALNGADELNDKKLQALANSAAFVGMLLSALRTAKWLSDDVFTELMAPVIVAYMTTLVVATYEALTT